MKVVYCPHCNQKYQVGEDYYGKTIECQSCHKWFEIHFNPYTPSQSSNPVQVEQKKEESIEQKQAKAGRDHCLLTRIWKWVGYFSAAIALFCLLLIIFKISSETYKQSLIKYQKELEGELYLVKIRAPIEPRRDWDHYNDYVKKKAEYDKKMRETIDKISELTGKIVDTKMKIKNVPDLSIPSWVLFTFLFNFFFASVISFTIREWTLLLQTCAEGLKRKE